MLPHARSATVPTESRRCSLPRQRLRQHGTSARARAPADVPCCRIQWWPSPPPGAERAAAAHSRALGRPGPPVATAG